jgi:integrase
VGKLRDGESRPQPETRDINRNVTVSFSQKGEKAKRSQQKPPLEPGIDFGFTEISYRRTEKRNSQQASHSTQVLCSHGVRLLCVSWHGFWVWASSHVKRCDPARRLQVPKEFFIFLPERRLGLPAVANKTGVADPREACWADAERKPLTDHVHDWHAGLNARERSPYYANLSRDPVLRLIEMTRSQRISQLSLSSIQIALSELRLIHGRSGNVGLSDASVNHQSRAVKMFSKWLWRDGRVREDSLCHLCMGRVVTKRTRNALEPEDAARVIATTRTEPVRWGVMGEDRSILYAIALGTGFRAKECRSPRPEDYDLDANQPTITCRAGYTKNHNEAVQPIRSELAEMLRPWVAGKAPGKPVFTFRIDNAARMLRETLKPPASQSRAITTSIACGISTCRRWSGPG